jgi:pentatricopeptide repeat protein
MQSADFISKQADREKIYEINNQISNHANRKELVEAIDKFKFLKQCLLPNTHTYAAIINAYIKCGDLDGAEEMFNELKNNERLSVDVISFTTMVKGYCNNNDIKKAVNLFENTSSLKSYPTYELVIHFCAVAYKQVQLI